MWQRIKIMNPNNAAWFNTKLANLVGPLQAWTIPNVNHCLVLTCINHTFSKAPLFQSRPPFPMPCPAHAVPKGIEPLALHLPAEIAEKKKVDSRISYLLHVYIYREIDTCIHTCIHACMHTYVHTYIPTPTYLHTYIPTYLHTYIPTYLHTCIPTYIPTYLHTYIPT